MLEIGRRNHNLDLTVVECFEITDKYTSGESALRKIRGKANERRLEADESRDFKNNNNKRKVDHLVAAVGQSNDRSALPKKGLRNQLSFEDLLDGPCLWYKGGHKARECFSLRSFTTATLKVAPAKLLREARKDKKDNKYGEADDFQEMDREVGCIFKGPDAFDSKHKQKLAFREVNVITPATP